MTLGAFLALKWKHSQQLKRGASLTNFDNGKS